MTPTEVVLALLAFGLMLLGAAGIVLPGIPDLPLIWLAALGYGLLAGFDGWVGGITMVVLTVLMVAGLAADLALGPLGARQKGASWQAIALSLVLALVGLFVLPPIGSFIGAFLGLFLVAYYQHERDARQAWEAVKGYILGWGASVAVRLALAAVMIVAWGVWLVIANAG
jgi:uncharacterized protein YqgC (DUF456 family)